MHRPHTPATPGLTAHPLPDLQARLHTRMRAEWLLSTGALLVLAFCLSYFAPTLGLKGLNNILYDRLAPWLVNKSASDEIVIVAIDDASIEEIGQWPWRRNRHAMLLEQLSEARAVALDVVFGEPNPAYPDDDAALADAIRAHGRVVLPLVIGLDGRTMLPPIPLLADAAANVGTINIQPDDDGVVRSIALQQQVGSTTVDHLSLALLEVGSHSDNADHLRTRYGTESIRIVFSRFTSGQAVVPYNRVLDRSISPDAFRDKYVLVGAWSSGVGDIFATPYSSTRGNMPGVEILANILNNGLSDQWVTQPGRFVQALLGLIPVLFSALAFRYLSPQRAFAFNLLMLICWLATVSLLLHFGLVWVPPSAALIVTLLAYPVWSWRSQHAALRHIDQELSMLQGEHASATGNNSGKAGAPATTPRRFQDQTLLARMQQLHGAIDTMRQAQRLRNETMRFLSHDMRAPLNSILALTDLQRSSASPQKLSPDTLNQFDFYATKTLALVDGFVALSRAEAIELQFVPVDLAELIRQACDGAWVHAQHKNITINSDALTDGAWVQADPGLLERACSNLLDNALKYSPSGTTVTWALRRDANNWVASIDDEGYGMDDAGLANAFAPFTRIDENRPDNPGGVGLGLAFVRTVVARHGGTITARSKPGVGTRFTLYLPAAVPPRDE